MADLGEAPNRTLLYPHEGIDVLRENAQGQNAAYELGQFGHFIGLQTLHIETMESRSRAFTVANGTVGADIFPSKQRLSEKLNELGYHAPRSVKVEPKGIEDGVDYSDQIAGLDEQQPERFCKPANGARGRGARMLETPEAALTYVAGQGEAFLVQSFEKPERDWRYILHRDSTQLESGNPAGWRVTFKVARPIVTGDGSKSIATLVAENKQMPDTAKQSYADTHKDMLTVVPADGEVLHLVQTGNRAQGAYREQHSEVEQDNLDRFMATFARDLETSLGTTLATLCFDLGIKDSSVLLGDYDFDRIRDNIVFYEHQLPFGMKPYLHEMIPQDVQWSKLDKFVPESRRRQYTEGQIYMNFIRSVIRSGRYLRQHGS